MAEKCRVLCMAGKAQKWDCPGKGLELYRCSGNDCLRSDCPLSGWGYAAFLSHSALRDEEFRRLFDPAQQQPAYAADGDAVRFGITDLLAMDGADGPARMGPIHRRGSG